MSGPSDLTFFVKNLRSRLDRLRPRVSGGIARFEHRVYSQHREDGIIRRLLDELDAPARKCVEFGFGPTQCNCLNLVLNCGYDGLFIDGNVEKTGSLSAYFNKRQARSVVVNRFLDAENINEVIENAGFSGKIDVLSVDVDGNDYWLWKAIDVCRPALVVAEYNASFGPEQSVTVPYDPEFVRYEKHESGFYHGASLKALDSLASEKGYSLVGCESSGVNAFFLDARLAVGELQPVSVTDAFRDNRSRTRYKGFSPEQQWDLVSALPYVTVGKD